MRNCKALIEFHVSDIVYECANIAYAYADSLPDEDGHLVEQLFDIAEGGNLYRLTRSMGLAFELCRDSLYSYTKKPVALSESRDNGLHSGKSYVLEMVLNEDFSSTSLDLLSKLIHEYIVSYCLWDWLSILSQDYAVVWRDKYLMARAQIGSTLSRRLRYKRRRLSPF